METLLPPLVRSETFPGFRQMTKTAAYKAAPAFFAFRQIEEKIDQWEAQKVNGTLPRHLEPQERKFQHCARMQEAARKDVERAFGTTVLEIP